VPDVPIGAFDDRLSATPADEVALGRLVDQYALTKVVDRWIKVVAGLSERPLT